MTPNTGEVKGQANGNWKARLEFYATNKALHLLHRPQFCHFHVSDSH